MKFVVIIMTGIGFTFGVLIGLLIQLPVDTLPADDNFMKFGERNIRSRRSLQNIDSTQGQVTVPGKDSAFIRAQLGSVGKQIPFASPDPVIGLNPFVSNTNTGSNTDSIHVDANRSHRNRNVVQIKSGISHGKYYLETKQFAARQNPLGHSDGARLQIKQEAQVNRADDSYKIEQKGLGGADKAAIKHGQSSVTIRIRTKGNGKAQSNPDDLKSVGSVNDQSGISTNPDLISSLQKVTSGIYWRSEFEDLCPQSFKISDSNEWKRKTNVLPIVKMEEGCGRMQNRLVTFRDATKACARYRINTDQIQGEIYSYYLAKLLNISNLPPSVLLQVNSLDEQWRSVHLDLAKSQWADDKIVILTQWIDKLTPAYIPQTLRENNRKLHPTEEILSGKPLKDVCDLLQWSDLIVFDYLTANLDRIVNNMFNRQWNDQMMNNPAHNLERTNCGNLVFLDNESGLFHGYRLLEKYSNFHTALLGSLCVFRNSTAQKIKTLHKNGNIGYELQNIFSKNDALYSKLPHIPEKNIKILTKRLSDVYDQITKCEAQYGR